MIMKTLLLLQLVLISLYSPSSRASLIGANPGLPTISFSAEAMIEYHFHNSRISINASPSSLFSVTPFILQPVLDINSVQSKTLEISFQVDHNGVLLVDNSNQRNLLLSGAIDSNSDGIIDYSGTLLTAEVTAFGFFNDPDRNDDIFDLRLDNVKGSLAFLYQDHSLEARIISESSLLYANAFNGSFNHSWQAQAKGVLGIGVALDSPPAPVPLPAAIWLWAGALLSLLPVIKSTTQN